VISEWWDSKRFKATRGLRILPSGSCGITGSKPYARYGCDLTLYKYTHIWERGVGVKVFRRLLKIPSMKLASRHIISTLFSAFKITTSYTKSTRHLYSLSYVGGAVP